MEVVNWVDLVLLGQRSEVNLRHVSQLSQLAKFLKLILDLLQTFDWAVQVTVILVGRN